ncbi:MAG: C40 family peptidase [Zoogloeaceae bacterium]|nr:C40 family peptidase [Zoogloeaceae bacterium]
MVKLCNRHGGFFFAVLLFLGVPCGTALADTGSNAQNSGTSLFQRYSNTAQDVLLKGFSVVGTRYRFGGIQPETGLDCSGFVQFIYREGAGLVLPRTTREQAELGEEVDRNDLKPGDLVFFNTRRRAFSHVGIYLGDDYFLHAPSAKGSVRMDSMMNHYWRGRYNGARRVLQTQTAEREPAAGFGGI